jgi:hypothetical protein
VLLPLPYTLCLQVRACEEGRRKQVWNAILTGCLIALEFVLFVAYVWRLRSLPRSQRVQDRHLWSYGLCILLLMTVWALSNLIYLLLNRLR